MEELRRYIREQIIKEIGEGTTPYPFSPPSAFGAFKKDSVKYEINAPVPIVVVLDPKGGKLNRVLEIDFYSLNEDEPDIPDFQPTNLGLEVMFRVLTTIKAIVKDYLERFGFSIKALVYSASAHKMGGATSLKKAKQRNNLYLTYIKKLFPNAYVHFEEPSEVMQLLDENDIITFIEFRKQITHEDL
jgi:hypothetical protein